MRVDTGIWCPHCRVSNDDIPRAEMLLAEGLANYDAVQLRYEDTAMDARIAHRIAESISGEQQNSNGSSDWSASYNGAGSVTGAWAGEDSDFDYGYKRNQDAYLAGAALAMALESDP
jgi:hypothetical protein